MVLCNDILTATMPNLRSLKVEESMEEDLLSRRTDIATGNHGVVSLERLQGQLLQRLDSLISQLLDLSRKHGLRRSSTVNAVCLDRNDNPTTDLQEQMGIQTDNTSLIGLSNICEDNIHHADQHSVSERVTSVLNDWDDVGSVCSHIDQITARAVGELDSKNRSSGPNNIRDVGNGCSRRSTEIENLCTGLDEDFVQTT